MVSLCKIQLCAERCILLSFEGCVSICLDGDHPCAITGSCLLALQFCFLEEYLPDPLLLHECALCCRCIYPDYVPKPPLWVKMPVVSDGAWISRSTGLCKIAFFPVICNVSIILCKPHAEKSQTRDLRLG